MALKDEFVDDLDLANHLEDAKAIRKSAIAMESLLKEPDEDGSNRKRQGGRN
jgi:hypothetical protein